MNLWKKKVERSSIIAKIVSSFYPKRTTTKHFCRRMDESYYDDWKYEFYKDLGVSDEPWYEEAWYDEDLIDALRDEGVPVTSESLEKFRDEVREIFEDKSERNEMLRLAARNVFN